MKQYTEAELIKLLREEDQTVFSYLYKHYAASLHRIIHRMVQDRHLAEDILQEVFILIWNNLQQYDESKGRFFTWMAAVTKNLTLDVMKSKSYRNSAKTSQDEAAVAGMPDKHSGVSFFDSLGIKKHLLNLNEDGKVLIDLAYFYGCTQDQIAAELGIPLGTVKTRIRTALRELRRMVKDDAACRITA